MPHSDDVVTADRVHPAEDLMDTLSRANHTQLHTLGTKGGVDAPLTPTEIAVTLLRFSMGISDRVIPGTSR